MLSNTIKQKRKEKAGKWEVPLPKVRLGAWDCNREGGEGKRRFTDLLAPTSDMTAPAGHSLSLSHVAILFAPLHRCGPWLRTRCSRCCAPASGRRRSGSAWSQRWAAWLTVVWDAKLGVVW